MRIKIGSILLKLSGYGREDAQSKFVILGGAGERIFHF